MNLLSFTGGGGFGYVQALTMKYADLSSVDVFAGTSVGSGNALAAAAEIPVNDVLHFYRDRVPKIFAGHGWRKILRAGIAPRYNDAELNAALKDLFGNLKTHQLRRPVIVVAHDLTRGQVRVIYSHHVSMPVWELARMSMAAHTYFDPFNGCADGGVFDNDPCLAAMEVLLRIHRHDARPLTLSDLNVFSLGSGANDVIRDGRGPRLLTSWLKIIISDTLDCGAVTAHRDRARTFLQTHGGTYACWEFPHCDLDFDNPAVIDHIDTHWSSEAGRAGYDLSAFFNLPPVQSGPGPATTASGQGGTSSTGDKP